MLALHAVMPALPSDRSRPSDSTACVHCGHLLDPHGWSSLPLVESVAPARVRELVTSWPRGAEIEVRRCLCGQSLARKVVRDAG